MTPCFADTRGAPRERLAHCDQAVPGGSAPLEHSSGQRLSSLSRARRIWSSSMPSRRTSPEPGRRGPARRKGGRPATSRGRRRCRPRSSGRSCGRPRQRPARSPGRPAPLSPRRWRAWLPLRGRHDPADGAGPKTGDAQREGVRVPARPRSAHEPAGTGQGRRAYLARAGRQEPPPTPPRQSPRAASLSCPPSDARESFIVAGGAGRANR